MQLDDLLTKTGEWLRGTGPNGDLVMSSRIRLARNLKEFPFTHWASKKQSAEVLTRAKDAIGRTSHMKESLFLKLADLTSVDKQFLLERHLVSRDHIQSADHRGVALSENEVISIMVNEEDHLRIQVIESGFNLPDTWKVIGALDDELSKILEFAYAVDLGYLTCCPTNTGTGLRASVMLHLPALVWTKKINNVLHAIVKIGLAARGFYGEGTEASGNFFQISNQVTLGQKEEEIIDNIERIIRQVMEHEQTARETLVSSNRSMLEDRIGRATGTLRSAHIITSKEATDLLSSVRLGLDLGLIKDVDRKMLNELFTMIQPAHLQKFEKKALTSAERDVKRAELIRTKLGGLAR